jgi:hypothetical protein
MNASPEKDRDWHTCDDPLYPVAAMPRECTCGRDPGAQAETHAARIRLFGGDPDEEADR